MNITEAIYKLYPNVIQTIGDKAYDKDNNEISYDKIAVENKFIELQNEEIAKKQLKITNKELALSKLTALGLTQDEVKALVG
jgi:hypothetical protein